jgi:hypothetical protein
MFSRGLVEAPPKIIAVPATVEPELPARTEVRQLKDAGPPVHPLAALLLVVVDNVWNLSEWIVIDWIITIPLSFVTVFIPALAIQKFIKRDPAGRALGLALLLGALAAIPTSITGTPVGLALLAWTGLNRLFGSRFPR